MKRTPAIAAVVVALAVGTVGGRAIAGDADRKSDTERGVAVAAPPTEPQPEQHAVVVALRFVTGWQRWLYLDDAAIDAEVRSVTTPTSAPAIANEVLAEVRVAREALKGARGRVWWLVRPLASRVDAASDDRARVSVWVVSVLSASDVAVPQSDWSTVTVELERDAMAWRVSSTATFAGPTPAIGPEDGPWTPERLDEWLTGFERVGAADAETTSRDS